jgi:hypothetical protein
MELYRCEHLKCHRSRHNRSRSRTVAASLSSAIRLGKWVNHVEGRHLVSSFLTAMCTELPPVTTSIQNRPPSKDCWMPEMRQCGAAGCWDDILRKSKRQTESINNQLLEWHVLRDWCSAGLLSHIVCQFRPNAGLTPCICQHRPLYISAPHVQYTHGHQLRKHTCT